ncbi:hypothetical protein TNCV_3394101 [Trichonephila clavipes]|nr:hypothetical protein TNCV_3394101 [Trichonephila clavipes]
MISLRLQDLEKHQPYSSNGESLQRKKNTSKDVRTPGNVDRGVSIQTGMTEIKHFFLLAVQEKDLDNVCLQQDGATTNTSRVSLGF